MVSRPWPPLRLKIELMDRLLAIVLISPKPLENNEVAANHP
jgi:hypothetical protein